MVAGQLPGMYFQLGKEKTARIEQREGTGQSPPSCAHPALGGRKDNLTVQGACGVSLCWGLRREWELLGWNGNYQDGMGIIGVSSGAL